jgi:hypothetical protein
MAEIVRRLHQRTRKRKHRRSQRGPLRYRVIHDPSPTFVTTDPDGTVVVHCHDGQWEAWNAPERFLLILAGTRGGKSSLVPWLLLREMQIKGPGEYLACAPTFKILKRGIYRWIRRAFVTQLGLGKIVGDAAGEFHFSEAGFRRVWPKEPYDGGESKIVFGHAANPDSLEAAEYKGAVCDEAGQKGFKPESWEAINRRVSIDQGRIILPTTPYAVAHWIKEQLYDAWERRGTPEAIEGDDECRVVNFESRMNPLFPEKEWDRAKAILPGWRFDLFYRGILTRPPGLIYDAYEGKKMTRPSWVPPAWARVFVGIDFGAPNFAATFFAEQEGPTVGGVSGPIYVAFAEYRPQENRTAKEHVEAMKGILGGRRVVRSVAGSYSEEQERMELQAAGWSCQRPDQPEVQAGIDRVYAVMREKRFFVTADCPMLLRELTKYSHPTDEAGNVMEGIEDKDEFHGLDSVRYIIGTNEAKHTGLFFINLTKSKDARKARGE